MQGFSLCAVRTVETCAIRLVGYGHFLIFLQHMVWRNAAKIVAAAAEAVGRAFTRAVREELRGKL